MAIGFHDHPAILEALRGLQRMDYMRLRWEPRDNTWTLLANGRRNNPVARYPAKFDKDGKPTPYFEGKVAAIVRSGKEWVDMNPYYARADDLRSRKKRVPDIVYDNGDSWQNGWNEGVFYLRNLRGERV